MRTHNNVCNNTYMAEFYVGTLIIYSLQSRFIISTDVDQLYSSVSTRSEVSTLIAENPKIKIVPCLLKREATTKDYFVSHSVIL